MNLSKIEQRRRPLNCPRCGKQTESQRIEVVRLSEEQEFIRMVEEPAEMSAEATFNTEEWIKYLPCECVVPPEEHKEAVNPTTPPDVVK